MQGILSHLSFYKEIHAILVLLKPNNTRLGIFFKHCIQQLLTYLHKDATHNIAFVFTNTRDTFFAPCETLPSLRQLLTEKQIGVEAVKENIFCFDNEAFRYLACTLQGVVLPLADFEKSWEMAAVQTRRLLEYTSKLRPHQVQNTLSLNDARRIFVSLSRLVLEFAESINENLKKLEEVLWQEGSREQSHATSEKRRAELRMKEIQNLVDEFKMEKEVILEMVPGFAAFLRTFAMIPVSNTMGEYIEMQIRQEEAKEFPNRQIIADLRAQRKEYYERTEIYKSGMQEFKNTQEGQEQAAQTIESLLQKGFNLKHLGEDFKRMMDRMNAEQAMRPVFHHGYVPRKPKKWLGKKCSKLWEYAESFFPSENDEMDKM